MTYAKSAKEVVRKIGCPFLNLYKGEGYWYFEYDDVNRNIFETESVYMFRLNEGTLEQWVEIGKEFVQKCETK